MNRFTLAYGAVAVVSGLMCYDYGVRRYDLARAMPFAVVMWASTFMMMFNAMEDGVRAMLQDVIRAELARAGAH
jgi:hypothetical protein